MSSSPLKILLVEDHELARNGLSFSLGHKSDYIVLGEAENGAVALSMLETAQPDIVLMDIGMPVMDGVEATHQIKALYPQIKVIMLTSHQNPEEIYAALAAGAEAYCLKDIKTERLVQIIEMVAEGAIWLDPAIARLVMDGLVLPKVPPKPDTKSPATRQRYNVDLTDREMEVLKLLVDGASNKDIADRLVITIHTVKAHVGNIMQKLAVDDRTQAAVKALREGILEGQVPL